MRTGFFGSLREPDHGEETRRAVLDLRRQAAEEEERQRLAAARAPKGAHSFLATFRPLDDRPAVEHIFKALNDIQAIRVGVGWARERVRARPGKSSPCSLRVARMEGGGKASTFEVNPLFAWKGRSVADLDAGLDDAIAKTCLDQLQALEKWCDHRVAALLQAQAVRVELCLARLRG